MSSFPEEARLRKVGMNVHRQQLTLTFDFPQQAQKNYDDLIDQLIDQTGWDIEVKQTVNQQALSSAIFELMPADAQIIKGPSIYVNSGEVGVRLNGVDDVETLKKNYLKLTGFRLITSDDEEVATAPTGTVTEASSSSKNGNQQMEINAAYGLIRSALNTDALNKTSLKQGQIVLTFISPQVGERYADQLAKLAEQTGYGLAIHPHPNQQEILQKARQLAVQAGWNIRKGPGIHTDRAIVTMTLASTPDEAAIKQVQNALEDATGYSLDVETA
jgi:hypothetical protein